MGSSELKRPDENIAKTTSIAETSFDRLATRCGRCASLACFLSDGALAGRAVAARSACGHASRLAAARELAAVLTRRVSSAACSALCTLVLREDRSDEPRCELPMRERTLPSRPLRRRLAADSRRVCSAEAASISVSVSTRARVPRPQRAIISSSPYCSTANWTALMVEAAATCIHFKEAAAAQPSRPHAVQNSSNHNGDCSGRAQAVGTLVTRFPIPTGKTSVAMVTAVVRASMPIGNNTTCSTSSTSAASASSWMSFMSRYQWSQSQDAVLLTGTSGDGRKRLDSLRAPVSRA
eukprot:873708-Pleurochrysis_carterae.AAC.2